MSQAVKEAYSFLESLPVWSGNTSFGLEIPTLLMRELGDPQDSVKTLHVAGTNGKGSVCAILASILMSAGKRVGQFASPHLSHVRERCLIQGTPIEERHFVSHLSAAREASERVGIKPSYFEYCTAISFLEFKRAEVDIAVVEVGLGGRLDASNVIKRPLAAIITSISLDHTHLLGETEAAIAYEKAGIIKSGVPVFCGRLSGEALDAVRAVAQAHCAPVMPFGRDFNYSGGRLRFAQEGVAFNPSDLALPGEHQIENAALAARVALFCGASEADIADGLRRVCWPGRLEHVAKGKTEFILDAAHNPAGISSLISYLERDNVLGNRDLLMVVSLLDRKDWQSILELLRQFANRYTQRLGASIEFAFTHSGHKSAVDPKELQAKFGSGRCIPSFVDAVSYAKAKAGVCVVTGSIFLVGASRPLLISEPFCTRKPAKT